METQKTKETLIEHYIDGTTIQYEWQNDYREWYRKGIHQQCVYVFYNKNTGFFKIGISKEPKTRLRHIETNSGCDLELILSIIPEYKTIVEAPKTIESILHSYFRKKNHRGEWFKLDINDLEKIRELFWMKIEGYIVEESPMFISSAFVYK